VRSRAPAGLAGLAILALAGFAVYRVAATDGGPGAVPARPGEAMLGRWPRSQFYMEPDRFLPATDPATIPASEARFLGPEDEVFGVVVGNEARAYPIPMIAYHHVVNDVVQGIPIAVTY
jgi:Protein of unknown function (DUF3179)